MKTEKKNQQVCQNRKQKAELRIMRLWKIKIIYLHYSNAIRNGAKTGGARARQTSVKIIKYRIYWSVNFEGTYRLEQAVNESV